MYLWRLPLVAAALLVLALGGPLAASAQGDPAAAPVVVPRQFKDSGSFSGGSATQNTVLSSIRFGKPDDATRMVLDFEQQSPGGLRADAAAHPVYSVEYREFPYRLVIRMEGTTFDADAYVQSSPALPFSIVTPPDGRIKEMQVYLPWPAEFKVIEVDDPAKLAIDVRRNPKAKIPTVYAVQIMAELSPEQAYALVEESEFPEDYLPAVLVLGDVVVVEQSFTDPAKAAEIDNSLREMGYSSSINERQGNELPLS
ncbi:hypothetical protein IT575_04310 [bacterium]|nr:hypothetical protein [bacterium]